jgi:cobalamin biosynthesis Mg chelatase CobN
MNKIGHKLVLILDQETPRSAIDRLHTLKADGYRVEDIPADGDALMRALLTSDDDEMFQRGD